MHVSLQTRVTALVVFAVTAITVGKGAFDLYTSASDREAAMASHLHMVTSMEARALARPLWDYNVEQVTAILAGLAREEATFVGGSVTSPNGKVIAENAASGVPPPHDAAADAAASKTLWTIEAPSIVDVDNRHETVGTLHVTYSRQALDAAWWGQVVQSLEFDRGGGARDIGRRAAVVAFPDATTSGVDGCDGAAGVRRHRYARHRHRPPGRDRRDGTRGRRL